MTYNADGQIKTTSVAGSSYTGLYAADGSWNIVINDGTTLKGRYHPSGALNAVVVADSSSRESASNGSINVIANNFGGYSPVSPHGVATAGNDGFVNAPTGTAQFPTLLNNTNYTTRPSWHVPGVDYRVGINTGVALVDAKLIPGIGIAGNVLTLSTPGQVINGYDFSLNGGYQLDVNASNVIFRNCKFAIGSNHFYMFKVRSGANDTTVEYCEFYDNYDNESGSVPNDNGCIIYCNGANLTTRYCYMEKAYADFFNLYGGGSGVIEYNVIHNSGAGGHPDWIALGGGTYTTMNVRYNLFYNQGLGVDGGGLPSAGTQGVALDGFGTYSLTGPFALNNNVLIAKSGASINYLIGWPNAPARSPGFLYTVSSNYYDTSGASALFGGTQGSEGVSIGNTNLGAIAPPAVSFKWVNNSLGVPASTGTSVSNGANTIANGDRLIMIMAVAGTGSTDPGSFTPPSGWTALATSGGHYNAGESFRYWIGHKVAASETGSYAFTWTNSNIASWALLNYGPTTSVDASVALNDVATGFPSSLVASSISPAGSTDAEVCAWIKMGGFGTATPPAGMTSRLGSSATGGSSQPWIGVCDIQLAASGATAAQTYGIQFAGSGYSAVSLALQP